MLNDIEIAPKILPIDFSVASIDDEKDSIKRATLKNNDLLKTFSIIHEPLKVELYDESNKPIGGRKIADAIYNIRELFDEFHDVIIDIGGLPCTLFAPLLTFLFKESEKKSKDLKINNLHVASLPEKSLDRGITSEQTLEPKFMYGFKPASYNNRFVWIPIIGKNDPERLRKIYSTIEKNCIETCPILPSFQKIPAKLMNCWSV